MYYILFAYNAHKEKKVSHIFKPAVFFMPRCHDKKGRDGVGKENFVLVVIVKYASVESKSWSNTTSAKETSLHIPCTDYSVGSEESLTLLQYYLSIC